MGQQFAARPADRQTVMARPARIFLAVELLLGVTYFLLSDPLLRAAVYCTLGLGMVVAVVGTRLYRPNRPLAWYLLAAGHLSFTVGDAINRRRRDGQPPRSTAQLASSLGAASPSTARSPGAGRVSAIRPGRWRSSPGRKERGC
jgi:hypothetical protein